VDSGTRVAWDAALGGAMLLAFGAALAAGRTTLDAFLAAVVVAALASPVYYRRFGFGG
jgi:predicted PurR-regulated permease PerM